MEKAKQRQVKQPDFRGLAALPARREAWEMERWPLPVVTEPVLRLMESVVAVRWEPGIGRWSCDEDEGELKLWTWLGG